jgi:hypothetical protein
MREHPELFTRQESDIVFSRNMHDEAIEFGNDLLVVRAPRSIADDIVLDLIRRANYYAIGVSGPVGTAYMWISKIF